MVEMINNKQLNHMNARIYYYDDGSEILTSYGTDVVKRTPEGKYIRLWKGWSRSTSKQVHTYCGMSFRYLPFEDGTYEDTKQRYKRKSYYLSPNFNRQTEQWYIEARGNYSKIDPKALKEKKGFGYTLYTRFIEAVNNKNIKSILTNYQTGIHKELKEYYRENKSVLQLLDLLRSCALSKSSKNIIGTLARLYDYDFMVAYNKLIENNKLFEGFEPLDNGYFGY